MQPLILQAITMEYYSRELLQPFMVAGNLLTSRDGYYLTIHTSAYTATSEASPLEGYSFENNKKAQHDLKRFRDVLLHKEIPLERKELFTFLKQHLDGCCASAKFAYESAIMDLAAQSLDMTLTEFLGGKISLFEGVGLLQGSNAQIRSQVGDLVHQGYRIFKLKVGDRNIPLDVTKVRDVRAAIEGTGGAIRLDANRSWPLAEAVLFAQLTGNQDIQFIEEPVSDPSFIRAFVEQTDFPVALDETLLTSRCDITAPGRCQPTLANQDEVQFYVLKPSLLGGIITTLDWIQHAKDLGKHTVISSMFETHIGMKILRSLSHLTDQVPGFGTERWLQ